MPSRTNLRIAEIIRQRAAHVILHELADPRLGLVTITRVKLSPDLGACIIFWSVLGEGSERSKTEHALEHARYFIQRRVAEGLRTRSAPQLSFEYDESVEGAIKMGGLLKQLREQRGDEPAPSVDAAEAEAQAETEGEDEDDVEAEIQPDDEARADDEKPAS